MCQQLYDNSYDKMMYDVWSWFGEGGGVNLLSKTLIWENDKNDSDIWPKVQNLEKRHVALYTHALVWNEIKNFVIFSSQLL